MRSEIFADPKKVQAFAQTVKECIVPMAEILRLEANSYWKIPDWSEIFIVMQPPGTTQGPTIFNSILSLMGEGWEKHGAGDDEYQWAVWNPKPGCSFRWQLVRWANVELYPGPPL